MTSIRTVPATMASRPNYFWMVLLGTSGSKRLRILSIASILFSTLFFGVMYLIYLEGIPIEYSSTRNHRSLSIFLFALGFYGTINFFIEWLGAQLFLDEQDFRYEDKPWKQRIRQLFLLKHGPFKTFVALAFGLIMAVIFDYALAGNLYGSFIGQTARLLADLFIFLTSIGIFAALFLRKQ